MKDENIPDDGVTEVQESSTSSNAGDAEDSGVGEVDMSNPEPISQCEGYGSNRSLCPQEATKEARYGGGVHKLCELCHEEYRAERDQWRSERFEEEQEQ